MQNISQNLPITIIIDAFVEFLLHFDYFHWCLWLEKWMINFLPFQEERAMPMIVTVLGKINWIDFAFKYCWILESPWQVHVQLYMYLILFLKIKKN